MNISEMRATIPKQVQTIQVKQPSSGDVDDCYESSGLNERGYGKLMFNQNLISNEIRSCQTQLNYAISNVDGTGASARAQDAASSAAAAAFAAAGSAKEAGSAAEVTKASQPILMALERMDARLAKIERNQAIMKEKLDAMCCAVM